MFDEFFLQYVWKYRLFDARGLTTVEGIPIDILEQGKENHLQGPDFLESKIKIGEQLWSGHVEIHVHSSEWFKHYHHFDAAYQNVILHVVWENDKEAVQVNGSITHTLELRNRIFPFVLQNYTQLQKSKKSIACESGIKRLPEEIKINHLNKIGTKRLERKAEEIRKWLVENEWNWELSFYQLLTKSMGTTGNSFAFKQLSEILPLKMLLNYRDNKLRTEALLFGQSGLLETINTFSGYKAELLNEYEFLKHKYNLHPMNPAAWKFGKIRPAGFPTLRISQLADLLCSKEHLFSRIMNCKTVKELQDLFYCRASLFWDNHYQFEGESKKYVKILGKSAIEGLIINCALPMMFLFGKSRDRSELVKRSYLLLEELPKEDNRIVKRFEKLGIRSKNALQSQGILETKNYCEKRRCLKCDLGAWLLTN